MGEPLSIRRLIERISSGDIRIPAFQRDFVWEPEQVAFLLDSIFKAFPIGTVILWRTDSRLSTEKKLGAFLLPEPQKDYPVNYVLDGQQRLTSLFSVFQTELKPSSSLWVDIYFDMLAEETLQESLFRALEPGEVDPARHFPVKTLFDTQAYRQATQSLDPQQIKRIDGLQSKFKEYLIPNEVFETDDRNRVAIVFERINRAGTELNIFELLSAWSWSEEFDLVDRFAQLEEEIGEHGFEGLGKDKDLLLRVCAGVIKGETTPKVILGLSGADIRARFDDIERGILGALDFLKREAGVANYNVLPFPALLVPLAAYFATSKADGQNYTAKQRTWLLRWFWRALFTRRFASDVNERQTTDIHELTKLREDSNYQPRLPVSESKLTFQEGFSSAGANSRTLILLLNSMAPISLISGAKIEVDKVLKKGSKHEYHHIFPKAHLLKQGESPPSINMAANICFLTRADNNKIKDKSPAEYATEIPASAREDYLRRALLPKNFDSMDYDSFIAQRALILEARAQELMNVG